MQIKIPEFALVALIGTSSSGKTTFAHKHFIPTEILSSDVFRGLISDDQNNQHVSKDAFDALFYVAGKRLHNYKTTVLDSTNLNPATRKQILELAKEHDVQPVAIVINPEEEEIIRRANERGDRAISFGKLKGQIRQLGRSAERLKSEGFRLVYTLNSLEEIDSAEIERVRIRQNLKDIHGPFDIIGDIHGCYDELCQLFEKLGYEYKDEIWVHPDNRIGVFLGDLCDRGPKNMDVLKLVMRMVKNGNSLCVVGNHDTKLVKKIRKPGGELTHGIDLTLSELEKETPEFKAEVEEFLNGLTSHYVLDNGDLVVSHAGIKEEYIGRTSGRVRNFCMYGETTGETDEYGLPIRVDWATNYRGRPAVVYGHIPHVVPSIINRTYGIDTGCVFGGHLSAFRWPEKEIVQVKAAKEYSAPVKPLTGGIEESKDILSSEDVTGDLCINTKLISPIVIRERQTYGALEVMSRFAADPHWLIYLPPTMSPCESSSIPEFLEYPTEAFKYYSDEGITNLICEKKHMGSRAVIVLCKNASTAEKRFGVTNGTEGIIYSRTGRRFFWNNPGYELGLLNRLRIVLDRSNFWEDFGTDWVCLDCELMPWSAIAQGLLRTHYGPVGRAGQDSLDASVGLLKMTYERNSVREMLESPDYSGVNPGRLIIQYAAKLQAMKKYVKAYQEYCWEVKEVHDIRIASFHLLACEGHVFADKPHTWHLEMIDKYIANGSDKVYMPTERILVDTTSEESINNAIGWWKNLTNSGGEGMVVKPSDFVVRNSANTRILQPAIKCRGVEYLRIIYGPDYLFKDNLERLKVRGLGTKRDMAAKEFALGMEALDRFVNNQPLTKVHECVFGITALESEPLDPRL